MDTSDLEAMKRAVAQGVTPAAVEALDALFPERCPAVSDTIDQIRYASGQRAVVRFIRSLTDA
jgi:hypothetical protein